MFRKLEIGSAHVRYVEAIQHSLLYDSSIENIAFQIMYSLKNLLSRVKGDEHDTHVVSEYRELLKEVLWDKADKKIETIHHSGDLHALNALLVAISLDHPKAPQVKKKITTKLMFSKDLTPGKKENEPLPGQLLVQPLAVGMEYLFSRDNPNLIGSDAPEKDDDLQVILPQDLRVTVFA